MFIRDFSGSVVYWNHGAEVLYGYSKAEAQGHTTLGAAGWERGPAQGGRHRAGR